MPELALFPESASSLSGDVDLLFFGWVAISAFFSLLIAAAVLYFFVRFRRRSADETGIPERASYPLEITWSVIPLVITLVMFAWGTKVFFSISRPPADAIEFFVTGKQWMWKIQHPEGVREINDLHVPVGVPIKMTMTSEDVIHSFFLPAFRVKADVLPGRYTTVWFQATKTGSYHLFCAEYCGAEHSLMGGTVYVLEQDAYEEWLAGGSEVKSPVEAGGELFVSRACNTCHDAGSGSRGPMLTGLFGREVQLASGRTVTADADYLRRSILDPAAELVAGYRNLMPPFQGQLTEEQVTQLIAYIKSLSEAGEGGAGPTAAAATQTTETRGSEP